MQSWQERATVIKHHARSAPPDASVLGWLRGTKHLADGRFRQGGHVLICAPTGAGKDLGAVIQNLLDYPGSASCSTSKARITPSQPQHAARPARTSSRSIRSALLAPGLMA
ncbi:type IV secretory system conjugative DNA transfer family protein [Acidisoma sp. S159]|uniref:type IV secretory system conjugative DNA transfer family protein n=1 Tax=Acidisoma sp. S159 TaxID=1747225 RepID=UPI00352B44BE